MKNSITIILIVIIGVFSFVSGYSIGFKNGGNQTAASNNQTAVSNSQTATKSNSSTTESKAVSGGYGAPAVATEKSASPSSAAPAGKTEAPAPAAPGYGK